MAGAPGLFSCSPTERHEETCRQSAGPHVITAEKQGYEMASRLLGDSQRQVSLQFEPGLLQRHRSLKDVIAAGVYRRGLKTSAADLDLAPGNLSVALSDEGTRKFGVDELERYIQATGDKTPIYYLVEKYLGDASAARDEALSRVEQLLATLPEALVAAGLPTRSRK